MTTFATTKLSSKGQVVISETIRKSLGLKIGDEFIVMGRGDTVILKAITPPSLEQFDSLLSEAQEYAQKVGLQKADIQTAIKQVRRKK